MQTYKVIIIDAADQTILYSDKKINTYPQEDFNNMLVETIGSPSIGNIDLDDKHTMFYDSYPISLEEKPCFIINDIMFFGKMLILGHNKYLCDVDIDHNILKEKTTFQMFGV